MKRTKLMKLRCFDVLKVQCWKIDFAITPCFYFLLFLQNCPWLGLWASPLAQPTGATSFRIAPEPIHATGWRNPLLGTKISDFCAPTILIRMSKSLKAFCPYVSVRAYV